MVTSNLLWEQFPKYCFNGPTLTNHRLKEPNVHSKNLETVTTNILRLRGGGMPQYQFFPPTPMGCQTSMQIMPCMNQCNSAYQCQPVLMYSPLGGNAPTIVLQLPHITTTDADVKETQSRKLTLPPINLQDYVSQQPASVSKRCGTSVARAPSARPVTSPGRPSPRPSHSIVQRAKTSISESPFHQPPFFSTPETSQPQMDPYSSSSPRQRAPPELPGPFTNVAAGMIRPNVTSDGMSILDSRAVPPANQPVMLEAEDPADLGAACAAAIGATCPASPAAHGAAFPVTIGSAFPVTAEGSPNVTTNDMSIIDPRTARRPNQQAMFEAMGPASPGPVGGAFSTAFGAACPGSPNATANEISMVDPRTVRRPNQPAMHEAAVPVPSAGFQAEGKILAGVDPLKTIEWSPSFFEPVQHDNYPNASDETFNRFKSYRQHQQNFALGYMRAKAAQDIVNLAVQLEPKDVEERDRVREMLAHYFRMRRDLVLRSLAVAERQAQLQRR